MRTNMNTVNFIDELDQNYYNGQFFTLHDEFVNSFGGVSPIDNEFGFFENYDTLSTATKDYDLDTYSISSDESTVILKIIEKKRFKLVNKLKRFLFR